MKKQLLFFFIIFFSVFFFVSCTEIKNDIKENKTNLENITKIEPLDNENINNLNKTDVNTTLETNKNITISNSTFINQSINNSDKNTNISNKTIENKTDTIIINNTEYELVDIEKPKPKPIKPSNNTISNNTTTTQVIENPKETINVNLETFNNYLQWYKCRGACVFGCLERNSEFSFSDIEESGYCVCLCKNNEQFISEFENINPKVLSSTSDSVYVEYQR